MLVIQGDAQPPFETNPISESFNYNDIWGGRNLH